MSVKRYIVIFVIRDSLGERMNSLRKEIAKRFDVHAALLYPPHVTLKYPFETDNVEDVERDIEEFAKECQKFSVRLPGFDSFGNRAWVVRAESEELGNIRKAVTNLVIVRLPECVDRKDNKIALHATLAYKDVTPEKFTAIQEFLQNKKFNEEVLFDNITILRWEESSWVLQKEFLL